MAGEAVDDFAGSGDAVRGVGVAQLAEKLSYWEAAKKPVLKTRCWMIGGRDWKRRFLMLCNALRRMWWQ